MAGIDKQRQEMAEWDMKRGLKEETQSISQTSGSSGFSIKIGNYICGGCRPFSDVKVSLLAIP